MPNTFFRFKQFTIHQDRCAMKVTTDGCIFGAWVAAKMEEQQRKINVLDIGTGTGLLTLMSAQKNKEACFDAVEIDDSAYQQAAENFSTSPWKTRINVYHNDIKEFNFSKRYDWIICNPPFYEDELRSEHPKKNVAHHDSALLWKELIPIIKENLSENGQFALLLPYKRGQEIKRLLGSQQLGVDSIVFIRPSTRHDYFRIIIHGSFPKKENVPAQIEEIAIKDETDNYTPASLSLLSDYYLNL